jgi:hypothetical protein
MKTYVVVDIQTLFFLTSALVGSEWSASRFGRFSPGEKAPEWASGPIGRHEEVKILASTGTQTLTSWSSSPQPAAILTVLSWFCDYLKIVYCIHGLFNDAASNCRMINE